MTSPRIRFLVPAACVLVASCGGDEELPRPKNLLVISVDTLRADFLGAYGADPSPSPRIDELAEASIVFERAVSHASWTLPSFAAVLTSLYSSTHRCWNFDNRLDESFRTLPEVFGEAGFDTVGMASHVYFNEQYGLQQGFDSFDDELAKAREDEGWVPVTSPRITAKAVRWLDARNVEKDSDPWLLWLHYFDPHFPYVPHGTPDLLTPIDRYRGEIAYTDRFIGTLLTALDRNGFRENTAVLFLSDHGEAFQEHPGVKRHAKSLYVEEVRVPLFLYVPGIEPRRVPGLVRTVDLYPTLLALFGISRPELPIEGVSLVPAMIGRPHESPPVLSEIRLHDGFHANAVTHGRWKLIEDTSKGRIHLFDVEADPGERDDLAEREPEKVAELLRILRRLVERAETVGELYEGGGTVELSDEVLQRLKDLGYVDEE